MKPKIVFLADKVNWAFSSVAQEIIKRLGDKYKFKLYHLQNKQPHLKVDKFDLLYVFFWGHNYWRRYKLPPSRVIREVASYRWRDEERYGYLTPDSFCRRYLNDCHCVSSPAISIVKEISEYRNFVFHTPNGIDGSVFLNRKKRKGKLKIGWVGNPNDPLKSLKETLLPAVKGRWEFNFTDGTLNRVKLIDFYNAIDVLAISSISESQPLPLLEGMACGCFPVATNVGIVPELISTKVNGLIVERAISDFREAFIWCEENIDYIRTMGEFNSKYVRSQRDWDLIVPKFDALFSFALEKCSSDNRSIFKASKMEKIIKPPKPDHPNGFFNYSKHLSKIQESHGQVYSKVKKGLLGELEPLLPVDKNQMILEIGSGFGYAINLLLDMGYNNVFASDISKDLIDFIQKKFSARLKGAFWCDGNDILFTNPETFDLVILYDVIEHIPFEKLELFISNLHNSLRGGGKVIVRTPNMALPLSGFSRYIDFTHNTGFTEFSLHQVMTACEFSSVTVIPQNDIRKWHVRVLYKFYKFALRKIFYLEHRTIPTCLEKNILIEAMK